MSNDVRPSDWVVAALGANIAVGVVTYPIGFFEAYFFNDTPGMKDHAILIAAGAATAILSALAIAMLSGDIGRATRAPAVALSASVAMNGAVLAAFFAVFVQPFGADPDVTDGMTATGGYWLAVACAAVAVLCAVLTVRLACRRPQLRT